LKELAFSNLYEIARRRWKTLVVFQVVMIFLAIVFCFIGEQKYESLAEILVMRKDSTLVASGTAKEGEESKITDDTLATQMQLLHSDKIINGALNKIVDRRRLEEVKAKQKILEKQTSTNLYYLSVRTLGLDPEATGDQKFDPESLKLMPIDMEEAFADTGAAAILDGSVPPDGETPATTDQTETPATTDAVAAATPMPEAKPATPAETTTPPADATASNEGMSADDVAPTPDLVVAEDIGDWLPLSQLPGILANLDTNEKVSTYIKDRLVISRGGSGQERESHVINIEFRHPDLVESKLILDAILASYQKFLDDKFSDVNKEAAKLIEKASKELEENLAEAVRDYQRFREQSPVVFADKSSTNIPRQRWEKTQVELLSVQLLLADARSRVAVIEPQLKKLNESGKLSLMAIMAVIDEKNAIRIGTLLAMNASGTKTEQFFQEQMKRQTAMSAEFDRLLVMTTRQRSMSVELGPKHPDVLKLNEEIEHIKKYLEDLKKETASVVEQNFGPEELMQSYISLLKTDVLAFEQREQDLLEAAAREEEESKGLIVYELEGEALRDQARRSEQLYQVVVERLGQINLAKDYSGFINEIMQEPEYGVEVWPNVPILLALAVALGLVMGAGTCGAQEYFDRSFRDPDEVRRDLDLPLLTHVPDLHKKTGTIAAGSRVHYSICAFHRPKSREAEVFRGLRTSLFFSGEGQECSVIMSTSPNKGDGKSTMVTNLAVSIAQAGYKILLIDCDMRRPSSHKLLGLSNAVGLSDLLKGDKKPGDVIQSTETDNLSVITSGPCPQNPAELLTSPAFANFLKSAREKYRFVLLDCPPVLAVADPCIIAPRADGVVMVLRVAQDSRPQAMRAKEMLQRVNGRILGVVVNASDEATKAGYGRYGESAYVYGYDSGYNRSYRNNGYYDDRGEEGGTDAKTSRDDVSRS
jgi:capsular exopolysaccharide synthesis family protein